jgi:hypothetical protein
MMLLRPTIFLNGDDLDLPEHCEARRALLSIPAAQVSGLEAQFLRGFFGALASFAASGLHCIGEMLFKSERQFETFEEQTHHVPTLVVHLRCDDAVRIARGAQRGDRPAGIAELTGIQEWVPSHADLRIDTTRTEPSEAAALIVSRLQPGSTRQPLNQVDLGAIAELRPYVRGGKLIEVPRKRSRRLILLDELAQLFNPGQRYSETEVNNRLCQVHPDYPALRRYLVDDGFLDRTAGEYWRSGGSIALS